MTDSLLQTLRATTEDDVASALTNIYEVLGVEREPVTLRYISWRANQDSPASRGAESSRKYVVDVMRRIQRERAEKPRR